MTDEKRNEIGGGLPLLGGRALISRLSFGAGMFTPSSPAVDSGFVDGTPKALASPAPPAAV